MDVDYELARLLPRAILATGFSRKSLTDHSTALVNVWSMEKPEWFRAVEASEGAPKSIKTSSARARINRLTHGFALLSVAVVVAAGDIAFAQSNNAPSAVALSSLSATTAQSSSQSASSATTAASGTSTSQPPIGLVGGRPSIAGGSGGDEGGGSNG